MRARLTARALTGAAALALGLVTAAGAQARPAASPAPRPSVVPSAVPTLPPVNSTQNLPYPAYGTPVPGIDKGVTTSGVPSTLTVQQAILIGFASSPVLASARADVAVARAPVQLAQSAIFPNVNGTLSSTRNHRQPAGSSTGTTSSTGSTTTAGAGGAGNSFTADTTSNVGSVALRQLIFDGGRVAAQIRAARANYSAASDTYARQLQTVAYNVANAYYGALSAARQTQVAVESVRNAEVQEALVTAQIRAGTTARADLSTTQLQTAQARLALVRAQGAELSAQAAFINAMGIDVNTLAIPQDDVAGPNNDLSSVQPRVATPTYAVAIERAYMLRPDLAAATQNVAGLEASLRAARLGNFPTLNGSASANTASSDPNGGSYRNSSSIGLALTIPIFDQGITAAQTAQAQGQLDRGRAQLDIARQGVQVNVKQALVTLVSARAAVDQANAEVSKAREVLQSTQAQYRAGVTTLPLLLNAQVGLTQALTDQVTAVYTLRQAEQAFLYAEGANVGG